MKVRVQVDPSYGRALKKLPPDRARAANASILKFAEEASLPSLDFRPLQGRRGHFLINGKRGDRIVLNKLDADLYAAVDVGPHDNILRRWNR